MIVLDAEAVVEAEQAWQTGGEAVPVFLLGTAPLHLAGSTEAGQQLVEGKLRIGDVFRPEVDLLTEDALLLLDGEAVG